MKTTLRLLLAALPLLFATTACDDDDAALPRVQTNVEFTGATLVDGTVYVLQGESFTVESVSVTAVNPKHQATIAGFMNFWFAGALVDRVPAAPYTAEIPSSLVPVGRYVLLLEMTVAEEKCQPADVNVRIPVVVVASEDDIPVGPASRSVAAEVVTIP